MPRDCHSKPMACVQRRGSRWATGPREPAPGMRVLCVIVLLDVVLFNVIVMFHVITCYCVCYCLMFYYYIVLFPCALNSVGFWLRISMHCVLTRTRRIARVPPMPTEYYIGAPHIHSLRGGHATPARTGAAQIGCGSADRRREHGKARRESE